MNTYDEYENEGCGEIDLNILELLEEERKWTVVSNFKNFISNEIEFGAIKNLSSEKILNIIETTTSNINKKEYPEWHITILIDFINELGYTSFNLNFVKNVYENIYKMLYI